MKVEESTDPRKATQIVDQMSPVTNSDVIPLLQKLQDAYGYLPQQIVLNVCERTGLAPARVFGVATFYEQFHLQPRGRHLIRCCRGTACHVRGGKNVLKTIQRELGIREGETTPDLRFTLETVACLGTCFLAPVIMIDDDYYGRVTSQTISNILENYT